MSISRFGPSSRGDGSSTGNGNASGQLFAGGNSIGDRFSSMVIRSGGSDTSYAPAGAVRGSVVKEEGWNVEGYAIDPMFKFRHPNRPDFGRITEPTNELHARFLWSYGDRQERSGSDCVKPLGCAYDEVQDWWMAAAQRANTVLMLNSEGVLVSSVKADHPASVAVFDPGRCYALLSRIDIVLRDFRAGVSSLVTKMLDDHRGLTLSPCRNYLMSVHRKRFPMGGYATPVIAFYDVRKPNEMFAAVPCATGIWTKSKPCFIDCRDYKLIVSDLGSGIVSRMHYNSHEWCGSRAMLSEPCIVRQSMRTPSGVCVDDCGNFLVAEAATRTLHWFDRNNNYGGEVRSGTSFPFISGITASGDGRLLVCARHERRVILYKLLPPPTTG